MNMKWLSFRLWIGALAVGLMGSVILTAAHAPGWLAGGLGLVLATVCMTLMVNDPATILNCPHCGRMVKLTSDGPRVCAKCGLEIRSETSQEL